MLSFRYISTSALEEAPARAIQGSREPDIRKSVGKKTSYLQNWAACHHSPSAALYMLGNDENQHGQD